MLDKSLTITDKLKIVREHFGLSQREFAELLGVSRGTIAAYEAPSRPGVTPNEGKLRDWAKRFGFPYSWYRDGDPEPPSISSDHVEAERLAATAASESNIEPISPIDLTYEEDDFATGAMVPIPAWDGVLANLDEAHFIEEKRPRRLNVPPFFFSRKNPERFIVGLPKGDSMAPARGEPRPPDRPARLRRPA